MRQGQTSSTSWALELPRNPSAIRLHVGTPLTRETIRTCPPAAAPPPVDRLLEIEAIRAIDLHPTLARCNLRPDADRDEVLGHAEVIMTAAWGAPVELGPDPGPRAFEAATAGPRVVAESPAMAVGHPLLEAVFEVDGVAEAIAGDGLVLVRLGRCYGWGATEAAVASAVQTVGGTPGSTSTPV